jgi:hypothetical protein
VRLLGLGFLIGMDQGLGRDTQPGRAETGCFCVLGWTRLGVVHMWDGKGDGGCVDEIVPIPKRASQVRLGLSRFGSFLSGLEPRCSSSAVLYAPDHKVAKMWPR